MSLSEEPMRPGEDRQELYLNPLGPGAIAVARHLGVLRTRLERLAECVASIAQDMALPPARAFSKTPDYLDEHASQLRHGCDVQKG